MLRGVGSRGELQRGLGSGQPRSDTWSGAYGPWSSSLGVLRAGMCLLPGHWPRRTQALGAGRTEHSLPGRGLGMKPQKELRFRS